MFIIVFSFKKLNLVVPKLVWQFKLVIIVLMGRDIIKPVKRNYVVDFSVNFGIRTLVCIGLSSL